MPSTRPLKSHDSHEISIEGVYRGLAAVSADLRAVPEGAVESVELWRAAPGPGPADQRKEEWPLKVT